jgi:hypothetical protein
LLLLASIHWLVLQLPRAAALNSASKSAVPASAAIAAGLLLLLLLLLFALLRVVDVGSFFMRT